MTTLAPDQRESRRERLRGPVLLAGAVLGASVLLHLRDPHESGSYGFCPWLVLTGTYCPGCGGLRAVNDLTHGDLRAAASSNLLLLGALPLLVLGWGRWFTDRWRGREPLLDGRKAVLHATVLGGVALLFTVVRNLPAGSWLAP